MQDQIAGRHARRAYDRAMTSADDAGFTSRVAQSARVNNYWQGGKDNFTADREAAESALDAYPQLPGAVRAGWAMRQRVLRYLIRDQGVRQVLDLGAGLPASTPVHEIARSFDPTARVFYVDHDPMVIAHVQALFQPASGLLADVRDTRSVLSAAGDALDLSEPVVVLMAALLHLIPDSEGPQDMVRAYLDAMPSGSYLMILHPSSDLHPEASSQMQSRLNDRVAQKRQYRNRDEVSSFFAGLELVEPGVVPSPKWRPDTEEEAAAPEMAWCGVARKS
jgi:hypothetical protein